MKRAAGPVSVCLMLSGCLSWFGSQQHKTPSEKTASPPPLYLGTVQQVYPEKKFVLLRIIGPVPKPGTTLISHPADGSTARIGNLEVSPMTSVVSSLRRGIIVADVRSGTVASGDRIFLYRNISEPESGKKSPDVPNTAPEEHTPPPTAPPGNTPQPAAPEQDAEPVEQPPPTASSQLPAPQLPPPPPDVPQVPDAPEKIPDYLKDIPQDVNGWN